MPKPNLRVQRWIAVLEDRPEGTDAFYTKAELHDMLLDAMGGVTIKSIKKETK